MKKGKIGLFAGMAVAAALGAPIAQAAVLAPPADARVIDFEDAAAPSLFSGATKLTDRYAPLGVTFDGVGTNGGAVLNGATFLITGESGVNFLAFNTSSLLQGASGVPSMPESLNFRRVVSWVQMNLAGSDGTFIQAEAFDEDGVSLGSSSVPVSSAMQTLVLEYPRIAKVVLTTDAEVAVVDDLAFTLGTTRIDFDDRVQPGSFVETVAARDEYLGKGVRFFGGSTNDGAGILAEDDGWGISGFSPPNILAINNLFGNFQFGGHPVFPVYLSFEPPVKLVRFKAGSGSGGGTLQVEAYDTGGTPIGSTSATMEGTMKTVSIATAGIATVKLSGDAPFVAIDDLEYLVQGTVIDFDDDTKAPQNFVEALPLRDRYEALGVTFVVKGEGGPAILDEAGLFEVTGYSAPKHLSWNFFSTLQNGAQPSLPVFLHFDPPIQRIEFLAGSIFGGEISLEAWDAVGTSVGTTDMVLTGKMQTLALPAEGAVDVTIYAAEESEYGILDNLAFQPVDACGHSACYVGDPLAYHCDPCVTKVCASNSDCCNDGWNLACAQSAESTCGLICAPLCGDANSDRRVTSTDALSALRTAVGTGTCPAYRCDFSGDGLVKSSDALLILKLAVGQSPTPKCPEAPPIT